MNATQTKQPHLVLEKHPIILFSCTKFFVKKINVGKILNYEKIVVLFLILMTS